MKNAALDPWFTSISSAWQEQFSADQSVRLNEGEVYRLLAAVGLTACPARLLPTGASDEEKDNWAGETLSLGLEQGRFLLKVLGRDILHKTEVGGVKVLPCEGLDKQALLKVVADMEAQLVARGLGVSLEGFLSGAFVPHQPNTPGQEVLLSLKQDPAFGACVIVGVGGTLTEWYGQGSGGRSTLILPARGLSPAIVREALAAHSLLSIICQPSRLYPFPPVSMDNLVNWIITLAELGEHCSAAGSSPFTLEELEINPAVAFGDDLVALDGVGLISTRKGPGTGRPVEKIRQLLAPRSAVVLGVSARSANPGRIILDNLTHSPGLDQDRLYVVHPKEKEISGVPCFPSIADLPEKCDLAVVSVPAQGAVDAISSLVDQDRAESIILIPGGFAEAGETALADTIENILKQSHAAPGGGPVMVGANCLGIVSRDNYNTFFLPEYKLPFHPGWGENLAVVSQSGAYLVTFASNYDGIINPRASISFGNQMDLTVGDFLEHFTEVPEVDVIACYVEGFRPGDGSRFLEMARRAKVAGKKVIIFKAGKTALGAEAAASHTASLAGDYALTKACLETAGVTVAHSLDHFEDLIKTFTLLAHKELAGNRVGIISNAGFECSTVMDQMEGLDLARFDDGTQQAIDEVLPSFAHRTNPIDCTPMTGTKAFAASCEAILGCRTVDLAILSSVPVTPALDNLPADPEGKHRENIEADQSQPRKMIEIIRSSPKPAVVVVDSGTIYDPMCRMIEEAGIPVFRKIDRAARALAAFCRS